MPIAWLLAGTGVWPADGLGAHATANVTDRNAMETRLMQSSPSIPTEHSRLGIQSQPRPRAQRARGRPAERMLERATGSERKIHNASAHKNCSARMFNRRAGPFVCGHSAVYERGWTSRGRPDPEAV